jgi:hypothetical protein
MRFGFAWSRCAGRIRALLIIGIGAAACTGLGGCCEVLNCWAYEPCPPPRCPARVIVVEPAPCPPPPVVEYRFYGPGRRW